MSKKEKKWRLFYKIIMVIIYGFILPLSVLLFFIDGSSLPWGIILAAFALPFMRNNHLNQIRKQEGRPVLKKNIF